LAILVNVPPQILAFSPSQSNRSSRANSTRQSWHVEWSLKDVQALTIDVTGRPFGSSFSVKVPSFWMKFLVNFPFPSQVVALYPVATPWETVIPARARR